MRTEDQIHRMGFLEKISLQFEQQGRDFADSGQEWKPPLEYKPDDNYQTRFMHDSAAYLSFTAYSKRKARLERMKA